MFREFYKSLFRGISLPLCEDSRPTLKQYIITGDAFDIMYHRTYLYILPPRSPGIRS